MALSHDENAISPRQANPRASRDERDARLRICVVGQFSDTWLPTQGEDLARNLGTVCRRVETISRRRTRAGRLLHVAAHILRFGHRYDVICLQAYGYKALVLEAVALAASRLRGRRVVLHLHNGALPALMDRHPRLYGTVYRMADASVCQSGYLQHELARHGLKPVVIPNAIDPAAFPFAARRTIQPRVLWMRAFHSIYNPMLALDAFEILRSRNPGATLTMAGPDKGMAEEVRQAAADRGLPVDFPGFVPRAELATVMGRHDVYLNTTRIDNHPLTVIEALLCGLPVVATAVGGVPYLLRDGETGLLVRDGDAEGCAAAIDRLVEDPELCERLSAAGRGFVEGFSWDRTLPLWLEVFDGVSDALPRGSRSGGVL